LSEFFAPHTFNSREKGRQSTISLDRNVHGNAAPAREPLSASTQTTCCGLNRGEPPQPSIAEKTQDVRLTAIHLAVHVRGGSSAVKVLISRRCNFCGLTDEIVHDARIERQRHCFRIPARAAAGKLAKSWRRSEDTLPSAITAVQTTSRDVCVPQRNDQVRDYCSILLNSRFNGRPRSCLKALQFSLPHHPPGGAGNGRYANQFDSAFVKRLRRHVAQSNRGATLAWLDADPGRPYVGLGQA
jgi:hypothetical protein